jgi:hypothetical protein
VIFRGLRKLGDSVVLSCIVPIDGFEETRIHAIPLSHHYENYGLLDESFFFPKDIVVKRA